MPSGILKRNVMVTRKDYTKSETEINATEALLNEARKLSEDLKTGEDASNLEKQGNAIGIILTLLTPIVTKIYVDNEDLDDALNQHRQECPLYAQYIRNQQNSVKLGGFTLRMPSSSFGISCLAFLYFIGKSHGWW